MRDNIYVYEDIKKLIADILISHGTSQDIAEIVSESLAQAEGKSVLSHGIMRLPSYVELINEGVLHNNSRPEIRITGDATVSIDGNHGFGMYIGHEAANVSSKLSSKRGISVAICRNIQHLGMLEYFTELSANIGFITIAMTNAHPRVSFPGGKEAMIGTNPISISVPSKGGTFSVDMAISKSSFGQIRQAAIEGNKIPRDIALDKDGNLTTDPLSALAGSLLPFGGIKGFALGMMVDILAGILSGSAAGKDVVTWNREKRLWNSGLFILSIDPGFFLDFDQFIARTEQYLESTRCGSPDHRVPGDRRRQNLINSMKNGLEIKPKTLASLKTLTEISGLEFPRSIGQK